jgi:hypothetical protein
MRFVLVSTVALISAAHSATVTVGNEGLTEALIIGLVVNHPQRQLTARARNTSTSAGKIPVLL